MREGYINSKTPFLKLDPYTESIDRAYVRSHGGGMVLYDVVDAWNNVYGGRYAREDVFLGRWHMPQSDDSRTARR